MMVVPAQWQGSVERFYHFFFGYFVPLVLWQERTGTMSFAVRDCGPMNPWFDLLRPQTDLELMPPGVMLQRVLTHLQERTILRDWDNPTRFHKRSIDEFVRTIRGRLDIDGPTYEAHPKILILDRLPGDAVFDLDAEVRGSGSEVRSLPNIAELAAALAVLGEVDVVDAAALSPADQVRVVSGARLLVAQHGAGMSNLVWLPAGAGVVEIQPPLIQTIDTIFANLASARELDYAVVPQPDPHAPANVSEVVAAVTRLLAEPGQHVPTMTGRWVTRVIRQLPRRL